MAGRELEWPLDHLLLCRTNKDRKGVFARSTMSTCFSSLLAASRLPPTSESHSAKLTDLLPHTAMPGSRTSCPSPQRRPGSRRRGASSRRKRASLIGLHVVCSSEIPREQRGQAETQKGREAGQAAEAAPWPAEVLAFCCRSIIQAGALGAHPPQPP